MLTPQMNLDRGSTVTALQILSITVISESVCDRLPTNHIRKKLSYSYDHSS